MSGWVQVLLAILASAIGGITINFTFRSSERMAQRRGQQNQQKRIVSKHNGRSDGRDESDRNGQRVTVLNGYAPILQKALDRIEAQQDEIELLKLRLSDCEERRRARVTSPPAPARRATRATSPSTTRAPSRNTSRSPTRRKRDAD